MRLERGSCSELTVTFVFFRAVSRSSPSTAPKSTSLRRDWGSPRAVGNTARTASAVCWACVRDAKGARVALDYMEH